MLSDELSLGILYIWSSHVMQSATTRGRDATILAARSQNNTVSWYLILYFNHDCQYKSIIRYKWLCTIYFSLNLVVALVALTTYRPMYFLISYHSDLVYSFFFVYILTSTRECDTPIRHSIAFCNFSELLTPISHFDQILQDLNSR